MLTRITIQTHCRLWCVLIIKRPQISPSVDDLIQQTVVVVRRISKTPFIKMCLWWRLTGGKVWRLSLCANRLRDGRTDRRSAGKRLSDVWCIRSMFDFWRSTETEKSLRWETCLEQSWGQAPCQTITMRRGPGAMLQRRICIQMPSTILLVKSDKAMCPALLSKMLSLQHLFFHELL